MLDARGSSTGTSTCRNRSFRSRTVASPRDSRSGSPGEQRDALPVERLERGRRVGHALAGEQRREQRQGISIRRSRCRRCRRHPRSSRDRADVPVHVQADDGGARSACSWRRGTRWVDWGPRSTATLTGLGTIACAAPARTRCSPVRPLADGARRARDRRIPLAPRRGGLRVPRGLVRGQDRRAPMLPIAAERIALHADVGTRSERCRVLALYAWRSSPTSSRIVVRRGLGFSYWTQASRGSARRACPARSLLASTPWASRSRSWPRSRSDC